MTKATNNNRDSCAIHLACILRAEDDRVVARRVTAYLGTKGHQVETVINGKEALASVIARPGQYEILILDHSMPELDGLQCARALRKMGYPDKTVVFASDLPLHVGKQFLANSVDRILHKSSDMISLGDAIRELLSVSGATSD